jgi:hypothetical protein
VISQPRIAWKSPTFYNAGGDTLINAVRELPTIATLHYSSDTPPAHLASRTR